MQRAINLAVHDFGSHVAGHAIHLKYYDAQGDPNIALSDARQALSTFHANIILGPIASDEAGAIAPLVAKAGVPMDEHALGSASQMPLQRNPAIPIYASALTLSTPAYYAAEWAYKTMHWHHMTMLGLDYSFGWSMVGAFVKEYRALGGKIDKYIWVPISTTDYSPIVAEIPRNTQAVFAVTGSILAVRLMDAYKQFGLHGKIPMLGGLALTDYSVLSSMKPAQALGIYNATTYCDGIKSPQNQKFTTEYHTKYHTYPGYQAEAGYTRMHLIIDALSRLHGDVGNKKALMNALMSANITDPRGPIKMNREFKVPVENMYICQVKEVKGTLRNVPVRVYKSEPPWGPLSKSAFVKEFMRDSSGRPS